MKKRVLFLHQNAVVGGAELHLLAIAQYFRESSTVLLFADGPLRAKLMDAGVDVRVLATPWALEGVRGGVPKLRAQGIVAVLRLATVVARKVRGYDIMYANSPKALTIATLAKYFVRRPVLWALHDLLDPAHFSLAAIRQIVTIANRGADRVVACSAASAAGLIRQGGHADRTHVVHQGIDPALFTQDAAAVLAVRREMGLGDGPVAGVFGRVTQWKGQHLAIELLGRLPGLWLLIVGDTAEDPSYADTLRDRAAELGVADRVRMIEHRDDVGMLMQAVDIVLHTSVAPEPFGRVIVEAMFSRRPVVATQGGGIAEIVEDGASGIVVPPGNVEALTRAVSALLRDPVRSRAIADAGYARAHERFTLHRMLAALTRHVDEVAAR